MSALGSLANIGRNLRDSAMDQKRPLRREQHKQGGEQRRASFIFPPVVPVLPVFAVGLDGICAARRDGASLW
jgi:hypothetical protein